MKKTKDGLQYSPSDLIRFMESPFASWMERYDLEIPNERQRDPEDGEGKLVIDAGNRHKENFLNQLRGSGTDLSEIEQGKDAFEKTREAIAGKREAIFQAALGKEGEFADTNAFEDFFGKYV